MGCLSGWSVPLHHEGRLQDAFVKWSDANGDYFMDQTGPNGALVPTIYRTNGTSMYVKGNSVTDYAKTKALAGKEFIASKITDDVMSSPGWFQLRLYP